MAEPKRRDPALHLLPQEKAIAYGLCAFAALVFAAELQPWEGGGRAAAFIFGLAGLAALVIVARQGHRVWTAFAAFLNGFNPAWGFAFVFGTLFVAYAFWLGWRAHRALKASLDPDPATPLPRAAKRNGGSRGAGRAG